MNVDLKKLAEQTLQDVEEFKEEGFEKEIWMMALHSAYQAGLEVGRHEKLAPWWEDLDKDASYQDEWDLALRRSRKEVL